MTTAGVVKVEHMARENDKLDADNAASVVVPPPKNLAVLLVTEGNFFLELAMKSLNLQDPKQVIPAAYEQEKPEKYDVIIFPSGVGPAAPGGGGRGFGGGGAGAGGQNGQA